jgi:hypothetical protein
MGSPRIDTIATPLQQPKLKSSLIGQLHFYLSVIVSHLILFVVFALTNINNSKMEGVGVVINSGVQQ